MLDPKTAVSSLRLLQARGFNKPLVFFAFDLLYLDGERLVKLPLAERTARLA